MAKRLNKNDIIRGRIFDQLAEQFGNSVLGMYDGKLRIEIIDEDTDEVVQFSLAPVVHKVLIDEVECDPYVTTDEKISEYQASLKKNETKAPKKKKEKAKKTPDVESVSPSEIVISAKKVVPTGDFNFDEPVEKTEKPIMSDDEQSKINSLMAELGF